MALKMVRLNRCVRNREVSAHAVRFRQLAQQLVARHIRHWQHMEPDIRESMRQESTVTCSMLSSSHNSTFPTMLVGLMTRLVAYYAACNQ